MLVDKNGWLHGEPRGVKVFHYPTVRTTALLPPGPRALVWHCTGGVGGPRYAEGLARRIQGYRRGVDRAASWHMVIARASGNVFQSAPLTAGAWHVGRPGIIDGVAYSHINKVTIGVELENAGPVAKIKGGFYTHPYWLDRQTRKPDPRCFVPAARVRSFDGRSYDDFTEAQVAGATELVAALAAHFGWDASAFTHDHAEFAAPVKTDPGPLWMKVFLPRVLSNALTGDGPTVVTGPPDFGCESQGHRNS